MAEQGPERLELARMIEITTQILTEKGLQWSSGTPEVVQNKGRRSRLFVLDNKPLPDDHFWITETCPETGAPATIPADSCAQRFEVHIHTLNELRADLEYYLSPQPPEKKPSARETELKTMLREAIPSEFLARLVTTSVENARQGCLKDGTPLLACTFRCDDAYFLLAQEISRAVHERLEAYEARHAIKRNR